MRATAGPLRLHRAARVVDGAGIDATPGVVLRRGEEVVAAGDPASIGVPAEARIVDDRHFVILPALGSAHTHLDLSFIAPTPPDPDFPRWLAGIRAARRSLAGGDAERSLRLGAELAIAGGMILVGDVLGAPLLERGLPILRSAGMVGVGFVEVFGAGRGEADAIAVVERVRGMAEEWAGAGGAGKPAAASDAAGRWIDLRPGIQPHAPHTTSRSVVEAALRTGLPFSIHLAESAAEVEYCLDGTGPMRTLLEGVGVIDPEGPPGGPRAVRSPAHPGAHPVDWMCDLLHGAEKMPGPTAERAGRQRLAVHLEELEEHHPRVIASAGIVAVYCPRASAFFGRRGLPWRELRRAGVPVALGTDGRMTLDTEDRISTLDEMRFLWRRDGASLRETLPMATIAVAHALGVPEAPFTLEPGPKPGLIRVATGGDPSEGLLRGSQAPEWIFRRGMP